jgi:hypothetical protein
VDFPVQYAAYNARWFFNAVCKIMMFCSTLLMILGLVLIWILYPTSYNYTDVSPALHAAPPLNLFQYHSATRQVSLFHLVPFALQTLSGVVGFYNTQAVGSLPENYPVKWRSSAFIDEAAAPVYLAVNPNASLLLGGGAFGSSPYSGSSDPFSNFFAADPFAGSGDPFASAGGADPFGRRRLLQAAADPFAALVNSEGGSAASDPFAAEAQAADPFAAPAAPTPAAPAAPSAGAADPFAAATSADPFAAAGGADPFAAAGAGSADPFGAAGAGGADPFSGGSAADPFAAGGGATDPFGADLTLGTFEPLELATKEPWDLEGGWITGMEGGECAPVLGCVPNHRPVGCLYRCYAPTTSRILTTYFPSLKQKRRQHQGHLPHCLHHRRPGLGLLLLPWRV